MCRTISLGENLWKLYESSDTSRNNGIIDSDRDHYPNDIKQLKMKVDNFVDNAAQKGKSWNSLGIKQAIEDKINIICYDLEILEKKREEVTVELHRHAKKWHALKKVRDSLNKELEDTNQRKKEACQTIFNLRKQYNKEGENFMSHWNKNIAFRKDYKKSVLSSLSSRQLNSDGSMKFYGHEQPLVSVTPSSIKKETIFTIKELKCLLKENVKVRYPFEMGKGGKWYHIDEYYICI
ncbi:hypothetical protein CsatA_016626 [Cannabis sativa]